MENPDQRGFTGFWLPAEIIDAKVLTWTQRLMWAEIHALQKGRLGKCIAKNEHFMALFDIGNGTVNNALTALKSHGWLGSIMVNGMRELSVKYGEDSRNREREFPKSGTGIPEIGNVVYKEIPSKVPSKNPPTPQPTLLEVPNTAEVVYSLYPRKVGKPAALKAIRLALKAEKFDTLKAAVERYALHVATWPPDRQKFIPHPATFFNQHRWRDPETFTNPGAPAYGTGLPPGMDPAKAQEF